MEEQRKEPRRADDNHQTPCPILTDYMAISAQIHLDLQAIKSTQAAMLEMLTAWNNMKGFVTTMRALGAIAKWVTIISGAATVIYLALKK